MTMARTEQWQRGRILQVLKDNGALGAAMSFGLLLRTLDTLGLSLSARELAARLDYLSGKEYLDPKRRKDMPGYDRDRGRVGGGRPNDIIAVKLTPKGQDLVDANIDQDPGIDFE